MSIEGADISVFSINPFNPFVGTILGEPSSGKSSLLQLLLFQANQAKSRQLVVINTTDFVQDVCYPLEVASDIAAQTIPYVPVETNGLRLIRMGCRPSRLAPRA